MVASGQNLLAEIPFVWVYNNKTRLRNIGSSDISEVPASTSASCGIFPTARK